MKSAPQTEATGSRKQTTYGRARSPARTAAPAAQKAPRATGHAASCLQTSREAQAHLAGLWHLSCGLPPALAVPSPLGPAGPRGALMRSSCRALCCQLTVLRSCTAAHLPQADGRGCAAGRPVGGRIFSVEASPTSDSWDTARFGGPVECRAATQLVWKASLQNFTLDHGGRGGLLTHADSHLHMVHGRQQSPSLACRRRLQRLLHSRARELPSAAI